MSYQDQSQPWRKLTLWQSLAKANSPARPPAREAVVMDLSSDAYVQTYIVLKRRPLDGAKALGATDDAYRDALFRFGSWCYSGRVQVGGSLQGVGRDDRPLIVFRLLCCAWVVGLVQLTPVMTLADIPHVIPVLRMQQSQLDFTCDVTAIPKRSPFARPLQQMHSVGRPDILPTSTLPSLTKRPHSWTLQLAPVMEQEILESEAVLANLVKRLSLMGFGENISEWLDGDSRQSFFEFQVRVGEGRGALTLPRDLHLGCVCTPGGCELRGRGRPLPRCGAHGLEEL
jgi:hypothetical protein